jgi:hypothetical protein
MMGREVRMVSVDWQHPKDDNGKYIPLFGYSYANSRKEWDIGRQKWQEGFIEDYVNKGWKPKDETHTGRYTEWAGSCPSPDDYMPEWPEEKRTHYMMYENTSEGTPISPAFATPEELAQWLVDNKASAFADMTATYDQWLRVAKGGYSPSAIIVNGVMDSGVAGLSEE